jgi:repressor LexA
MPRKSAGLGARHFKIMDYLVSFQGKNGYSPSIRQIGENIGVSSTSLVDYYLRQLEDQNYIERDSNVSRSIRVIRTQSIAGKASEVIRKVGEAISDLIPLPLVGRIVASTPIPVPPSDFSYFDYESSVEIARSMLPSREKVEELFALEVQGDSMIDAMVNDGDIVVMKKSQEANNGDMVAVWLNDNDETTLKYFYKEKNRIRLQPANPTMEPIYVNNPKQLRIMGKVVMVIRQIKPVAA